MHMGHLLYCCLVNDSLCCSRIYILLFMTLILDANIYTRDPEALISRVFWAQVQDTTKGDWCQVVREDLDNLGLKELSFVEIGNMSKNALKDIVSKRTRFVALNELLEEKSCLSKVAHMKYDKLEIQPYLTDKHLPIRIKQQAFRWRTRMVKVGWNYGRKDKCPICLDADDKQSHLLECKKLNTNDFATDGEYNYDLKLHMTRLEEAIRRREVILEELKDTESI